MLIFGPSVKLGFFWKSETYLIKNEVPLCPGSNLDQFTKALGGLLN